MKPMRFPWPCLSLSASGSQLTAGIQLLEQNSALRTIGIEIKYYLSQLQCLSVSVSVSEGM